MKLKTELFFELPIWPCNQFLVLDVQFFISISSVFRKLSIYSRIVLPLNFKTSVIWQKDESQDGSNKKTKHAKFSEKPTFLTPWHLRVRIRGVRNVRFLENLACFVFLVPHSVLKFFLSLYYQRKYGKTYVKIPNIREQKC